MSFFKFEGESYLSTEQEAGAAWHASSSSQDLQTPTIDLAWNSNRLTIDEGDTFFDMCSEFQKLSEDTTNGKENGTFPVAEDNHLGTEEVGHAQEQLDNISWIIPVKVEAMEATGCDCFSQDGGGSQSSSEGSLQQFPSPELVQSSGSPKNADESGLETKTVVIDPKLLKLRSPIRKATKKSVPDEQKDAEYFAKREKNTLAAKKCRDNKRETDQRRVDIIKLLLEENVALKARLNVLHEEGRQFRRMMEDYNRLKNIVDKILEKQ